VPPPAIRMITDNVATQFGAHRTDNVDKSVVCLCHTCNFCSYFCVQAQ